MSRNPPEQKAGIITKGLRQAFKIKACISKKGVEWLGTEDDMELVTKRRDSGFGHQASGRRESQILEKNAIV
jgi:hypothetical protein